MLWQPQETNIVGYSLEQPKFGEENKPKCESVILVSSPLLESCTAGKLLFRKKKITGFRDWNVQAILSHSLPAKDISDVNLENILHFPTGMKWKYSTCSKTLNRVSHSLAPN